jgi:hypothetical protein
MCRRTVGGVEPPLPPPLRCLRRCLEVPRGGTSLARGMPAAKGPSVFTEYSVALMYD